MGKPGMSGVVSALGDGCVFALDTNDPASIARAAAEVRGAFPEVHVLVNNAGIFPEKNGAYDTELTREIVQVNTLGPLRNRNYWA